MVDTSTEAVTKLLDGVTPGPWYIYKGRGYCSDDWIMLNEDCSTVFDCTNVDYEGGGSPPEEKDSEFIRAARDLVPALLAERDALKSEVERLRAQPAQAVKVKRLRYFDPQGDTLDQMRDHARQHPLAKEGDMKLVWVNEVDLYNHVLSAIQHVHPITLHDAARVVADGLADGEVWRVAVNGAAAILNSGMPEEYWTPVKQIRETLDAALRAIAEGRE